MNLTDILLHFLNFSAPALALALVLPLLGRILMRRRPVRMAWWIQVVLNFCVGVAALAAAVVWLGRDGKIGGYALLVVAVATAQWLWMRGWRS